MLTQKQPNQPPWLVKGYYFFRRAVYLLGFLFSTCLLLFIFYDILIHNHAIDEVMIYLFGWLIILFLLFVLFLFWGDYSESFQKYFKPYQAIWLTFSIVTLSAGLMSYQGYQAVTAQVKADLSNETLVRHTVKALVETSNSLTAQNTTTAPMTDVLQVTRQSQIAVEHLNLVINRLDKVQVSPTSLLTKTKLAYQEVQQVLSATLTTAQALSQTLLRSNSNNLSPAALSLAKDLNVKAKVADQAMTGIYTDGLSMLAWLGFFYMALVLFPWVLLLLFIVRLRESRAKQIWRDLDRLGLLDEILTLPDQRTVTQLEEEIAQKQAIAQKAGQLLAEKTTTAKMAQQALAEKTAAMKAARKEAVEKAVIVEKVKKTVAQNLEITNNPTHKISEPLSAQKIWSNVSSYWLKEESNPETALAKSVAAAENARKAEMEQINAEKMALLAETDRATAAENTQKALTEKEAVEGEKARQIAQLDERAFSNVEYILNPFFLSLILALGWYYIFYPQANDGLAYLIENRDSGFLGFSRVILNNLNPITMGFVGAYFFSIQFLVRRYLAHDLYPSAFLQVIQRFLLVFMLSLVLSFIATTNAAYGNSFVTLAFIAGIFPRWALRFIQDITFQGISYVTQRPPVEIQDAPLTKLDGMDIWSEERLLQRSIENVQSLATAPIHRLVIGTPFPTMQIVDWIDQAILYTHCGKNGEYFEKFRAVGIRSASDLLDMTKKPGEALTLYELCGKKDFVPDEDQLKVVARAFQSVSILANKSSSKPVNANSTQSIPQPHPTNEEPAPTKTPPPADQPTESRVVTAPSDEPEVILWVNLLRTICDTIWPDPNIQNILYFYERCRAEMKGSSH